MAAIWSGVGRLASTDAASVGCCGSARRGDGGWASDRNDARGGRRRFGLGFGVEAGGGAGDLFLEQAGAMQALGDAGEDQREMIGAEGADEVGGVVGDGALAQRGGELLAVVDEPADEREQAAGAAWWGLVRSGGRGRHERKENTEWVAVSRIISWGTLG